MNTTNFTTQLLSLESNLSSYAYKLTGNSESAKDLVQDTFYKALSNENKFDCNTSLRAWVFTILKNTFINDYRRRAKRGTIMSQDVHEYVVNNKPADLSPESDINYKELNSIVNSIEPEFRVPFQMYDKGYKYQEIADELGINIGTIKSRIHFSKKMMKEKIEVK